MLRMCVASSFGTESAVLLHMYRHLPVIFVDTGKLFPQTLEYKLELTNFLDLDVNTVIARTTPLCCSKAKREALDKALKDYNCWITGRKRYQGGKRTNLQETELIGGKIKLNPLAEWTKDQIEEYFEKHNLPRHPLADLYEAVGCVGCTPGCGRKGECGIHEYSDTTGND